MGMHLPVLETKRLILREISKNDLFDMYEYAHLPEIGPNAGWEPHSSLTYTRDIITAFLRKSQYGQPGVYAIVLKEGGKMIGTVELFSYLRNFKAELGYTINPDYWGHGYAAEASAALIHLGFTKMNLKRIECCCFTTNAQSRRVCEKLGMRYEGIRKKGYMLYNGEIKDLECYAMTDDEYQYLSEEREKDNALY